MTDQEYEAAVKEINALLRKKRLTVLEERYLDALADAVWEYEEEHYPVDPPMPPTDMLRYLVREGGHLVSDVAAGAGTSAARILRVLRGREPIDEALAGKLGAYFCLKPSAFGGKDE